MRIIRLADLALDALHRARASDHPSWLANPRRPAVLALPDDATARQVADAHGWAYVGNQCNECGAVECDVAVDLGDEPDYDSSTARVCVPCLRKALEAAVG